MRVILLFVFIVAMQAAQGQVSFSVSPSKLYFSTPQQAADKQVVTVQNNGDESRSYLVNFVFWDRDKNGGKRFHEEENSPFSAMGMLRAQPAAFNLDPGEKKEVQVILENPLNDSGATSKWAMMMIKEVAQQPKKAKETEGFAAVINVEYQIGVHIYQTPPSILAKPHLDIDSMYLHVDYQQKHRGIRVLIHNFSKAVNEIQLKSTLYDTQTDSLIVLPNKLTTLLPQQIRSMYFALPENLDKGDYSFTISIDPGSRYPLIVGDYLFKIE